MTAELVVDAEVIPTREPRVIDANAWLIISVLPGLREDTLTLFENSA